jgi:putative addiction module antidote
MIELTVLKIENSFGVILPEEVVALLGVKEGDTLFLTETSDGYRLTSHDPESEPE